MALQVTPLPAFNDNYIWLLRANDSVVVVDPGCDKVVLNALSATEQLDAIWITHHHADHTGGVAALLKHFPHCQVYGPDDPRISPVHHVVGDNADFAWQEQRIQVLAVPGHTRSHIAFFLDGWLFCGDTLFSAGCGRLFEGSASQMYQSLGRIQTLPDSTRIACAHEYTLANLEFAAHVHAHPALQQRYQQALECRQQQRPTLPVTLTQEKQYNPFLRCHDQAIVAAASRHAGRPCLPGEDTFAVLRQWKDQF